MLFNTLASSLAALFLGTTSVVAAPSATGWTRVDNWGSNPTNLTMNLYLPKKLAENPPVVLALHGCVMGGWVYSLVYNYRSYADSAGFILAYPTANNDSTCWDVASPQSLQHDGGGDSTGLRQMVDYLIQTYKADPKRVFVTGMSSGCMMTNVMMATYPEVFAAGSCYSGTAAGCWIGSPGSSPWSSNGLCANGKVVHTSDEWADIARNMSGGYTGQYPRMQTFHGTDDSLVVYANLGEQLKQWSALLGVAFANNETNSPESGYTKMVYGDGTRLVGYSAQGVGHTVPNHGDLTMRWFGLI